MKKQRTTKAVCIILIAVMLLSATSLICPAAAFAAESDPAIGSERRFGIPGSFFIIEEDAVLAAQSNHALVYVVKSDKLSSYKDFYPNGTAENAIAKGIAAEFEKMYSLISTPGLPAYYGQPYDLNGNGKIIILLCDIGDDGKEAGSTVGGYVSGIFNAADFTNTNKAAMIHVDIAPNQGYGKFKNDPNGFYQTVMHEYAHLVSFSHVYTHRQTGMPGTNQKYVIVEEAFAELAGYLYHNQFGTGKLQSFFTSQFLPNNSFLSWQTSQSVFLNANYGAAVLLGLTYYNHGGNIYNLLSDPRGVPASNTSNWNDSLIAMGDHFVGAAEPSATFDNFNKLFNQFALDTYVADPLKQGPYIKNVNFNSWSLIDLYGQPVLEPGKSFYFSYLQAPYMPQYFVRPHKGTRLPVDMNVIKMTLTDTDAKSRFYAVYPNKPFSGFGETSGRTYTELIPGQEMTIPVGQGNEFAVFAVNYNYSGTDATVNYTAAKDTRYPFQDIQVPDVRNLKVEHGASNVAISWDALTELPDDLALQSYEVYRSDTLLGTVSASNSAPGRTDSYANLEVGRSYEYSVKAIVRRIGSTANISSTGTKTMFTLLPVSVAAPTNASATLSSNAKSVTLRWERAAAVYGANLRQAAPSGYEIYRNDELIHSTGSSSSSYTNSQLESGKTYVYKIRSTHTSGGNTVYSEFTPPVTAAAPTEYALIVTAQTGGRVNTTGGSYTEGTRISLTATANTGYTFDGWTSSNGGSFGNTANRSTTFTMPAGTTTVTAKFKQSTRAVTVNGSHTSNSGARNYAQGATVTIRAGTRSGYTFNGWTVNRGGVTLANRTNATTTFTMPANTVTVTANWTQVRAAAARPKISKHPKKKRLKRNAKHTLSVAAKANPGKLSYQWYSSKRNKNSGGKKIRKANKPGYTPPTKKKGSVYYYCIVTNTDNSAAIKKSTTKTKVAKVTVR
ncbi:MAG: InlB B-repeat-containing protein [Oscillospiraceae bacterium]|nr:InlB B-repeat-containing protein [Oscillospiraceae bacterium]